VKPEQQRTPGLIGKYIPPATPPKRTVRQRLKRNKLKLPKDLRG
jgi:hypothetical protein